MNSAFSGGKTATTDFTLYTSPYLVAQSGGRYTKHIYVGSQRIVSKLGDFDSYGADPRRIEKAGDSFSGVKVDYASKYKSALNVVKANYESLKVPYYGLDNEDYVNGLGFCCKPANTSPPLAATTATTATTSPTGKTANSKADNAELQQYYYHPDHLGSSSYISNLDGEVVQHVEYVPFGEVFLEEKNAVWNTPYLFNGKELDKETGMSYYGARYYEPKTSVWISVDPLAEKYPEVSPYNYCLNNPVRYTDPDGRLVVDSNGNIVFVSIGKDKVRHAGDKVGANVEYGYVFTNDGKAVLTFRNLSNKKGWDTDCHGQTFTKGKLWINNDEVDSILKGDGYVKIKEKNKLRVGDVVVYRNKETGEVEDSRTVSKVDKKTGKITVYGQGGLEEESYNSDIDKTWDGNQTYYRKTQQDKKANQETIKIIKKQVQEQVKQQ